MIKKASLRVLALAGALFLAGCASVLPFPCGPDIDSRLQDLVDDLDRLDAGIGSIVELLEAFNRGDLAKWPAHLAALVEILRSALDGGVCAPEDQLGARQAARELTLYGVTVEVPR